MTYQRIATAFLWLLFNAHGAGGSDVAVPPAASLLPLPVVRQVSDIVSRECCLDIPRGGSWLLIPPGWNPWGYCVTGLGEEFLTYDGSIESDVGRFLASLKKRKRFAALKEQWLEIVRVSKSAQTMRIYRQLNELLQLCIRMRLVD